MFILLAGYFTVVLRFFFTTATTRVMMIMIMIMALKATSRDSFYNLLTALRTVSDSSGTGAVVC